MYTTDFEECLFPRPFSLFSVFPQLTRPRKAIKEERKEIYYTHTHTYIYTSSHKWKWLALTSLTLANHLIKTFAYARATSTYATSMKLQLRL